MFIKYSISVISEYLKKNHWKYKIFHENSRILLQFQTAFSLMNYRFVQKFSIKSCYYVKNKIKTYTYTHNDPQKSERSHSVRNNVTIGCRCYSLIRTHPQQCAKNCETQLIYSLETRGSVAVDALKLFRSFRNHYWGPSASFAKGKDVRFRGRFVLFALFRVGVYFRCSNFGLISVMNVLHCEWWFNSDSYQMRVNFFILKINYTLSIEYRFIQLVLIKFKFLNKYLIRI